METRLDRIEALLEKITESQNRADERLAKRDAQLEKTDAQMAETNATLNAKFAELADEIKKVSSLVGNVTQTDSYIAEQKMYYALKKHLRIGNMQFDEIKKNLRPDGDNGPEFDIVLINGDSVCIVEVKKNANIKEVDALIEKTISNFKEHCTKYADYKIYFALASVNIYPDLVTKSAEKGIFLLTEQNEVMEILNDKAAAY